MGPAKLATAIILAVGLHGVACAAGSAAAAAAPVQPAIGAAPAVKIAAADPFGSALPSADLDLTRGGQAPIYAAITDQTLSAMDSGNTINATSVTTGMVTLQTGAFAGFNGLGNFVINTGNNNNLQGSLSLTVVLAPAH